MIDIDELRQNITTRGLDVVADTAVISELLDRLEAAERERDDIAQQLVRAEIGKRKLDAECDELYAKVERMGEAMESLLIRCDDSDSAMYGTLSTSFVRDTIRIARAALEAKP